MAVVSVSVSACDNSRSDESGATTSAATTNTGGEDGPLESPCKLVSLTELADEHEVAPNQRSGSEILAAVPESLHTALHWDFSTTGGIEVEVPGTVGLSTGFDVSFTFPAEPKFYFEDVAVADPDSLVYMECYGTVMTTVDVHMESDDGTILLDLTDVPIRLGPHRPEDDHVAKPMTHQDVVIATLEVNFLKPEALVANPEKRISILFDGLSTRGSFVVYGEGSSRTYQHLVARW